ncbi:MAG: hypothetical protein ACOC8E_00365 [Planctomycetota bacterium]
MKADVYVAPDGDDEGPGTVRKPFATLARALRPAEIERHAKRPGKVAADKALVRHWGFEMETTNPAELERAQNAGLQRRFRKLLLPDEGDAE